MGQSARVRRVCERAAVASIALLGPSCLNELEPSIAQNLCKGNVPDGLLDPGEECDTKSYVPGDGCDPGCRVECPPPPAGFKDPATHHCYFFGPGAASHGQGDDLCQRGSSLLSRLVTVRSAREAAFLRDALARSRPGAPPTRVRSAYAFGRAVFQFPLQLTPGGAPLDVTLSFRQAAPSPFLAEPGLLAYYTVGNGLGQSRPTGERPCTGCYGTVDAGAGAGADGEQWWGPATDDAVPELGLAFDVERGAFVPLGLDQPAAAAAGVETLCERVPDSRPHNACAEDPGACADGASLRFRLGASIYSYFDEALGRPAAAARCAAFGATLWVVDDEDERERVLRLLAAGSAPLSSAWPIPTRWGAWVGASRGPGGAWSWDDGTPAAGDRAVPWALDPASDAGTACGYVLLRGDGFDRVEAASSDVFALGLVIPSVCELATAPAEPAHPGLLCEQPAGP